MVLATLCVMSDTDKSAFFKSLEGKQEISLYKIPCDFDDIGMFAINICQVVKPLLVTTESLTKEALSV
jgi:hypothetical protein